MELLVNGQAYQVDTEGDTPLLWALRDDLGLTGTKYGCGLAQCGACSVMIDGSVTRSCVTPIDGLAGRNVTTIEAVERDPVGQKVIDAWVKHQVPQCGYCQSGQVVAATALLKQVTHPSDAAIAAAMINLCRCGTYNAIRAAIHEVAGAPVPSAPSANSAHADHASTKNVDDRVQAAASVALAGVVSIATVHSSSNTRSDSEENLS